MLILRRGYAAHSLSALYVTRACAQGQHPPRFGLDHQSLREGHIWQSLVNATTASGEFFLRLKSGNATRATRSKLSSVPWYAYALGFFLIFACIGVVVLVLLYKREQRRQAEEAKVSLRERRELEMHNSGVQMANAWRNAGGALPPIRGSQPGALVSRGTPRTFPVTVPEGAIAGSQVHATTPDGVKMSVFVPGDCSPGSVIMATY